MFYITVRQSPMYHQMTLEEFLFQQDAPQTVISRNISNTRTYETDRISMSHFKKLGFPRDFDYVEYLTCRLESFNDRTCELRERPRHDLYYSFFIPKKSGGFRKIDAPEPELMAELRTLKSIFELDFNALYHTSAFAYVHNRSTIDAVKRHQANESRWFGKYDLSNFFGSTTLDFIIKMLSVVFPFSEVAKTDRGMEALRTAVELATLDGVLPQGTPISPLLTNVMMIPIDYKLSNQLRDYNEQRFVYTRYADDFLISSKYNFDFREIERYISNTLASFGAPFTINPTKTRYGSSSGSNWNLGVMLNKDNQITVGYKKKRQFHAMLNAFVLDMKNGVAWPVEDIQRLDGYRNYYRMVEGSTIDDIVSRIGEKYGVNIPTLIKEKMRAA